MSSVHQYIDYPYISKSLYTEYKTCKYRFKRFNIDGVAKLAPPVAQEGTNLHFIFDQVFTKVNRDEMLALDWQTDMGTEKSQVWQYLYAHCTTMLPTNLNNEHVFDNIKAFCSFEESHWVDIRRQYRSLNEIWGYWFPISTEHFLYNDEFQIYGTWDRINKDNNIHVIGDYKTGRVPDAVARASGNNLYAGGDELPNKYTVEGNFYCLLWLLEHEWMVVYENEKFHLRKSGRKDNDLSDVDYCFIFTNGRLNRKPYAHVIRKKASITSIRAILKNLPLIRSNTVWERCGVEQVCKWCQLYETECKGVLPFEIFGDIRRMQDAPSENVPEHE
jgi:hypothetical protein